MFLYTLYIKYIQFIIFGSWNLPKNLSHHQVSCLVASTASIFTTIIVFAFNFAFLEVGIFQRISLIIKLHVWWQARLQYRPQPRGYCSECFQHLWRFPKGQFPYSQPCTGGQRGKESIYSPCHLRFPYFCSLLDWTLYLSLKFF